MDFLNILTEQVSKMPEYQIILIFKVFTSLCSRCVRCSFSDISIVSFRKVESATVGDQDLIMECNFTSESVDGIRITWIRHGMPIHSRSHSRFRITVKKYGDQEMLYTQLRITHACMSDTGKVPFMLSLYCRC